MKYQRPIASYHHEKKQGKQVKLHGINNIRHHKQVQGGKYENQLLYPWIYSQPKSGKY